MAARQASPVSCCASTTRSEAGHAPARERNCHPPGSAASLGLRDVVRRRAQGPAHGLRGDSLLVVSPGRRAGMAARERLDRRRYGTDAAFLWVLLLVLLGLSALGTPWYRVVAAVT